MIVIGEATAAPGRRAELIEAARTVAVASPLALAVRT